MRYFAILFALLSYSISVIGQVDSLESGRKFFYRYDGKISLGSELIYTQPVMGAATINVDGVWAPVDSIMFYSDEIGFFVNTKYSNPKYQSQFAIRTIKGKYNYYTYIAPNNYLKHKKEGTQIDLDEIKGSGYFSLGYNDPVPANAKNMRKVFANDPLVAEDIKMLKRYNSLGAISILAGVSAIAAGIFLNRDRGTDPTSTFFEDNKYAIIGGSAGAALIATGVFIIAKGPDRAQIVKKANGIY